MPVHDWTRVDAGIFHAFHTAWLGELQKALNRGGMPPGYSAMVEQYGGMGNADVLALQDGGTPPFAGFTPGPSASSESGGTAVALADAPPVAEARVCVAGVRRYPRRELVIRHRTGRRPVALIEIVSSGNKASVAEIDRFVSKVADAVAHGLHVLVADLHPPTARDPDGIHGLIGPLVGDDGFRFDPAEPLTAASYLADDPPIAYLKRLRVGADVPDMPLFLDPGHYVSVPLAATYAEAFGGMPSEERKILGE